MRPRFRSGLSHPLVLVVAVWRNNAIPVWITAEDANVLVVVVVRFLPCKVNRSISLLAMMEETSSEFMLTRIHNCLSPHVLHSVPTPLHPLILVDRTAAVVVRLMLGLDFAVVDLVLQLQTLKRVLHLLLPRC